MTANECRPCISFEYSLRMWAHSNTNYSRIILIVSEIVDMKTGAIDTHTQPTVNAERILAKATEVADVNYIMRVQTIINVFQVIAINTQINTLNALRLGRQMNRRDSFL